MQFNSKMSAASAMLTVLSLVGAASAQLCVPPMGSCSDGEECCSGVECIRKNDFYAQCRAPGDIPTGWPGALASGVSSTPEATNIAQATATATPEAEDLDEMDEEYMEILEDAEEAGDEDEEFEDLPVTTASPAAQSLTPSAPAPSNCVDTFDKCNGDCCDPDDHCVRHTSTYAQCRPKSFHIRDEWDGTIIPSALVAEEPVTSAEEVVAPVVDAPAPAPIEAASAPSPTGALQFSPTTVVVNSTEPGPAPVELPTAAEAPAPVAVAPAPVDEEPSATLEGPAEAPEEPGATLADTVADSTLDPSQQCIATTEGCGGGCGFLGCAGRCCDPLDHCVRKNNYYAQCRKIASGIPDTWLGDIITPAEPVPLNATAFVPTTPSTTEEPSPVAGVVGQCAANYGKCGAGCGFPGCSGNCCDPEFHCMRKFGFFAQCRPKTGGIPSGWEGTILTPADV